MKKTFWFWLYFVVAIILAVYFATRIIMTSLGHGSVSTVKTISISADSHNKNLSKLAAVAGIAPGTNVYSLNLDEINARISTVPDIKYSAVRRLPNGNLAIKVKLHKAVAIWTDGKNLFPLSSDGTIVKRPLEQRPPNTIVFSGILPPDINEIVKTTLGMAKDIDYMEWIENRRWNIHTTNNISILLPEEDPCAAISALMVLNKNNKILSKKIKTLDMRDPARIIIKQ
ncbi:MAG: cell division protein FtsQ/DivIB [Alphaproteobacteria bacterium]|nr:cell division protein FtsQ/DivIB [Alphaproteobacteria bacterium]MBN2674937.1 cell division protein FtsQ/DivIB [Alphaproteobacteria bacterium]